METKRVLPKIHKHDISLSVEGIGSNNPKEYCYCDDCKSIRNRRDKIYSSFISRIKRWCNNNI